MTKIFSWKAILTQDEHKMPPTLPPCFNNITKSPHFRSTGQNQGLRLTVFDALGRVCHTPQAHRQVGHPPQIIARGLHDIQNPFHPPSRRPEMKARCCTKSWQGASRFLWSYDAGQNLILVHLLSIAEPICFSQHPTCKRNINCGQNQGKVDSLTVLD